MATRSFVLSILLLCAYIARGQTLWEDPMPTILMHQTLTAVACPDSVTIVVSMANGSLARSTDRGRHWNAATLAGGAHAPFTALSFADAQSGFAAGDSGAVACTRDGGASWTLCPVPLAGSGIGFKAVANPSPGMAICAGDSGAVFTTRDWGNTWVRSPSPVSALLRSLSFPDTSFGFCVGASGAVIKTTDFGGTWKQYTGVTHGSLSSVFFVDHLIGYVGLYGMVMKTTNGGEWWGNGYSNYGAGAEHLLCFSDSTTGIIAFGERLVRTGNALRTVTHVSSESAHSIRGIAAGSKSFFVAVGDSGALLLSEDGGQHWFLRAGTMDTGKPLSLSFPSLRYGWYGSSGGRIWRSIDSAFSWHRCAPQGSADIVALSFSSRDSGCALTGDAIVYRTTNAGDNWIAAALPVDRGTTMHALSFRDRSNGYAVGNNGSICYSENGGAFWGRQWSGTTSTLTGVCTIENANAIAVGREGTVLRTTDEGNRWDIVTSGQYPDFRAVTFTDVNTGFAVGDSGLFLRSMDAGASWERIVIPTLTRSQSIRTVAFADALRGVIGLDGEPGILETTDGGNTWNSAPAGSIGDSSLPVRYICSVHPLVTVYGYDEGRVFRGQRTVHTDATFSLSSTAIGFGKQKPLFTRIRRIWLANIGNTVMGAPVGSIEGPDAAEFSTSLVKAVPLRIDQPRQVIDVTWRASMALGPRTAALRIRITGSTLETVIPLTGEVARSAWNLASTRADFGEVEAGDSADRSITMTRAGNGAMPVPAVSFTGPDAGDFTLVSATPDTVKYQGGTTRLVVRCKPTQEGRTAAWLRFTPPDSVGPLNTIALNATRVRYSFSTTRKDIDFGLIVLGSSVSDTLRIFNTGSGTMTISRMWISGADSLGFRIARSFPSVLGPGQSDWARIDFVPAHVGASKAVLCFTLKDVANTVGAVPLTGDCFGTILTANPDRIAFPRTPAGNVLTDSIRITNTGPVALRLFSQTIVGPDSAAFSILQPAPGMLEAGASSVIRIGCSTMRYMRPVDPWDASTAASNDAPFKNRGRLEATLLLLADDYGGSLHKYPLSETPLEDILSIQRISLGSDSGAIGERSLYCELRFHHGENLTIPRISVEIVGSDAADFTVENPEIFSLGRGVSVSSYINLSPRSSGWKDAVIRVRYAVAREHEVTFPLRAIGCEFPLTARPRTVLFDTVRGNEASYASIWVVNTSSQAQHIGEVRGLRGTHWAFSCSPPSLSLLSPGDSARIDVSFRMGIHGWNEAVFGIFLAGLPTLHTDVTFRGFTPDTPVGVRTLALSTCTLGPPWPHPARDIVTVPFSLATADHAVLSVHDALGRRVAVLADDSFAAGEHTRSYDARTLPCGVYLVTLETGSATRLTRRLLIAR